ncbi:MAG: hypothetical protein NTW21_23775 [Verrucomicrobia bacterium]|nr:hypothetical protein [Verrucomicrobiota bacterium]
MKALPKETIFGQPSWTLASDRVTAAVTQCGGHLAPVSFRLGRRSVQPFAIAPWWNEKLAADTPPILRVLRGDFFCLPFGGNATPYRGQQHPAHGDTANRRWRLLGSDSLNGVVTLRLGMDLATFSGQVEKRITLRPGQTAVYQEHVVSGVDAPTSLGHHATLQFPERPGAGHFSTSGIIHAQVFVEPAENPATGGYSLLQPGALIKDLTRVPTITGGFADLSRYPARRGYTDLAIFCADPALPVAWSAVALPEEGYAWFSLRDPQVLASTLLWMSNNGRHYPPWNSRHQNVMGVEDITAFFHCGAAESARPNVLSRHGVKTSLKPTTRQPLHVRYIMGLVAIPKTFGRVRDIEVETARVTLVGSAGTRVSTAVDTGFLQGPG